jgi:hypothetical protein
MTTVYGFWEMKPVALLARNVACRRKIRGLGRAVVIIAAVDPTGLGAEVAFVVEEPASRTSTQGPQWEDAAGLTMADAA